MLILYIDGMVFGDHPVMAAMGVDAEGRRGGMLIAGEAADAPRLGTSAAGDSDPHRHHWPRPPGKNSPEC